jgi:hypothetical protein
VVTVRVKVMTGKSRYDLIVVDRALYAAAASCGNYTAASRKLKAEGVNVPVRTLQTWCQQSHASRYGEIREEVQNDPDVSSRQHMKTLPERRVKG